MNWQPSTYYVVIDGSGKTERRRFPDVDRAARSLRWARGDAWRIAKVTVEPIDNTSPDDLHRRAVVTCGDYGHAELIASPSGALVCSRCTEIPVVAS